MGQHGYVRDVEWKVEKKDENTLVFTHQSDDTTKEKYPFDYEMELIYHMNGNRLEITWNIKNTGKEKMYFSCGSHHASPARYMAKRTRAVMAMTCI